MPKTLEPTAAAPASVNLNDLVTALSGAITAAQPIKKATYADVMARNPEPQLPHPVYQNGFPVNPSGLSTDTLKKLAELPSGTYIDGLVTATRTKSNTGGEDRLDLQWDMSHDPRQELYSRVRSLSDLIAQAHAAAFPSSAGRA